MDRNNGTNEFNNLNNVNSEKLFKILNEYFKCLKGIYNRNDKKLNLSFCLKQTNYRLRVHIQGIRTIYIIKIN